MMQTAGLSRFYFIYTAAHNGSWGELAILRDGEDMPTDYQLVDGEPISPMLTREQIAKRLRESCRRLPLIGAD